MTAACSLARMTTEDPLAAIASELYAGPLESFIERRGAAAREASDPALAASVRALRKPTVAAWVVNVFARERANRLAEALDLAAELREAQAELDARALQQLGRDRRTLTERLASEAADIAQRHGERVTPTTRESVRQTLSAAFFDADAAAAVASGRLIRELEPTGDTGDLGDVVGGGAPSAPPAPTRPVDEVKARRERKEAERALRDATQERDRIARAVAKAEKSVRDASAHAEELDRRRVELERELESLQRDIERTRRLAKEADEAHAEARDELTAAEHALVQAESALDRLT